VSLKDIHLGPLIQEVTEWPVRHDVRIPADLALAAKADVADAARRRALDPTLNPLEVRALVRRA
jgi:hypothetical protein